MSHRKSKSADLQFRTRANPLVSALAGDASWIMLNLPLAKIGEANGVHRMRTSVRRLRSDLKTFRDRLDPAALENVQTELKWVFSALGQVRELDVQRRWCLRSADSAADKKRLAPLFQELDRRRAAAMVELSQTLESERFWRLAATLSRGLPIAKIDVDEDGEGGLHPRRMVSLCAKLADSARGVAADTPAETFHEIRLVAKRARYAAEAIARWTQRPRSAKRAERWAIKIRRIQDALGDHQDAVVAFNTVQDIVRSLGSVDPEFAAAKDRLLAALARARDRSTVKSLELLKRFRRKRAVRFSKKAAA